MAYRVHVLFATALVFLGCSASSSGDDLGNVTPDSGASQDSGKADGNSDAASIDATAGDSAQADSSSADATSQDSATHDSSTSDSSSTADADAAPDGNPTILTGKLVGGTGDYPGAIAGVWYKSGSVSGVTTSTGEFSYEKGAAIQFGVADVSFRQTKGSAFISPWQLAAQGDCVGSDDLNRLLVLLQSLDTDNDPITGTSVAAPEQAPLRALSSMSDTDVLSLVQKLIPGRQLVDTQIALHRYITQMDGELWAEQAKDTFNTADSAIRSQGVTTDGTNWYFSWRLGLTKTDLSLNTVTKNLAAIPVLLATQGSDHIGDIDYWNGKLYIPLEDSAHYKSPYIVLFDTDLNAGQQFSLPNTMLTKGVPWVAVDGPRSSVYVAEWDPTPSILVFSLANISFQRSIALSTTLGRIQGAKVFETFLYANADNDAKTVYKINLETGTVIPLFSLNISVEVEGLAFLNRPDGTTMHTLNTTSNSTAMEFRHHARTRDPLRKAVCQ
jgi:hypothetical protein